MQTATWFARLDPVHRTYNRVRWRYACHADAPQSGKDIALAAKNLPGVHDADTFNVLRIVKFGYEWEIPQVVRSATPAVSIAHPDRRRPPPCR